MTRFARSILAPLVLATSAVALSGCETFMGEPEAAETAVMEPGPDVTAQVNDAELAAERAAAAAARAEQAAERAAAAAERAQRAFQLSQQK